MRVPRVFALVVAFVLSAQLFVPAQIARAEQSSAPASSTAPPSSTAVPGLDLSSAERNLSLGNVVAAQITAGKTVAIQVGGNARTLAASDLVTAAELVAAMQVAAGGAQHLIVGASGAATGGYFRLDNTVQQIAGALVVPHGVSAIRDFAGTGTLSVAANLVNYGTIYGISTSTGTHQGAFQAVNILNQSGGQISSNLAHASAFGLSNLVSQFNLSLAAVQQIFNAGSITSAGNLSLSAASIVNQGSIFANGSLSMQAQSVQNLLAGQITAGQNVAVNTASLLNSGSIAALKANILLNMASLTNLNSINGAFGVVKALAGNVDVVSLGDLDVSGGDWLGKRLSWQAAQHDLHIAANSLSGPVYLKAGSVSCTVGSGLLNLAAVDVSGDPLFVNSAGDVQLAASINTPGAPVTVIASGSILGAAGGTTIDTSGNAGGDVLLLAGTSSVMDEGQLRVIGAANTTGNILNIKSINSNASGTGNAGDIFVGTFSAAGNITIDGPISANGLNGTAGQVTVVAPGNIALGDIASEGGHSAQSAVTLRTALPVLQGTVRIAQTGQVVSGTVAAGNVIPGAGNITVGIVDTACLYRPAGSVAIAAGGALAIHSIMAAGGTPDTTGSAGTNGGAVTLSAGGLLELAGDINTTGGHGRAGDFGSSENGGDGADAGAVTITGGSDVKLKSVFAYGGGGGGGAGSSKVETDAGNGGDGGNGGDIAITAAGDLSTGIISSMGGNGGGGGGGCCIGGTGGNGGVGNGGQIGGPATAQGALLGTFPYGTLPGGYYSGPGGGWQGGGGYGGGGAPGGWWGFEHGGTGGTGGNAGNVELTAQGGINATRIDASGGGSGGGGGMTASGGGGASGGRGGRGEDRIVSGDGIPGGAPGYHAGGGGGGFHYYPGAPGGVTGGSGGAADPANGGPSGGGGGGGWVLGGLGGGWGPTGFGGDIAINAAGGSVNVSDDINAFSFTKAAGSISINAAGDVRAGGAVRADSGTLAGNITINAGNQGGLISVGEKVDAYCSGPGNGGNIVLNAPAGQVTVGAPVVSVITTAAICSGSAGADAGDITVNAVGQISVNGSIQATGGKLISGDGGNVSLLTAFNTTGINPVHYRSGRIVIAGFVDTSGGSHDNTGGDGGSVELSSGAVRVLGANVGASIKTSGGGGSNSQGTPGSIAVNTYAVQPFPFNFDLASEDATEFALPGALFTVGSALANGTAGTLVAGNVIANALNAGRVVAGSPVNLGSGKILLTATGGDVTINQGGTGCSISADDGTGWRTLVTPAQAVALFQVSRDAGAGAQTIGLNSLGAALAVNPNTGFGPAIITVTDSEVSQRFANFNLSAADGNAIHLNITGTSPTLFLKDAKVVNVAGAINFLTAGSTITMNLGTRQFIVAAGGAINADDTSCLTMNFDKSGTWNNFGSVHAGKIYVNAGTLNVIMGDSGVIAGAASGGGIIQFVTNGTRIVGGRLDDASLSFLPASIKLPNITLAAVLGPQLFLGKIVAQTVDIAPGGDLILPNGFTAEAVQLIIRPTGQLVINGLVAASNISITSGGAAYLQAGSLIEAVKLLKIIAGGGLTVAGSLSGSQLDIRSAGPTTLQATSHIDAGGSVKFTSLGGITAAGAVTGLDVTMTGTSITLLAGSLIDGVKKVSLRPTGDLTIAGAVAAPKVEMQPAGNLYIQAGALLNLGQSFVLSFKGNADIQANLTAGAITLAPGGHLTIGPGVDVIATGALQLNPKGDLVLSGHLSGASVKLASGNSMTLSGTASVTTPGLLSIKPKLDLSIASNVTLAGGSIDIYAPQVTLGSSGALTGISATSLTWLHVAGAVNFQGAEHALTALGGMIDIKGRGNLAIANGSNLSATTGISLSSQNVGLIESNLSLGSGVTVQSQAGSITLSAKKGSVEIGAGSLIEAGIAGTVPTHGSEVVAVSTGRIVVYSTLTPPGGIGINVHSNSGAATIFRAVGGQVLLSATAGDIEIGDNAFFQADAANVRILASGNVTGGTGNNFVARVGYSVASKKYQGGGVEITSGNANGYGLSESASKLPNPPVFTVNPRDLSGFGIGSVNYGGGTGGVINLATLAGGTINMSSSGALSTVNVTGAIYDRGFGVALVNATASGAGVNMNGATINVGSLMSPIAFVEHLPASEKLPLETAGPAGLVSLGSAGRFSLARGWSLVQARGPVQIKTSPGMIYMKPGALAVVEADEDAVRVFALSSPGAVSLVAGKLLVRFAPGQEVAVYTSRPGDGSRLRADGIGRRRTEIIPVVTGSGASPVFVTVCDVSIITLLREHPALQQLSKRLREQILKTAAVVHAVTAARGPYQAVPADKRPARLAAGQEGANLPVAQVQ